MDRIKGPWNGTAQAGKGGYRVTSAANVRICPEGQKGSSRLKLASQNAKSNLLMILMGCQRNTGSECSLYRKESRTQHVYIKAIHNILSVSALDQRTFKNLIYAPPRAQEMTSRSLASRILRLHTFQPRKSHVMRIPTIHRKQQHLRTCAESFPPPLPVSLQFE